ncbi:MAG: CRISPR-associated protein Csx15 [Anaerolineae bacterium]|nr:CRISPR-associated protein Csx15 [Anaerolineae bacterium]MDW8098094.1 CRISPR-associated protein Csx15 [Anaerolineae bacterium]
MIVLNFSHPLTLEQLAQLEALMGQKVERIVTIPTQFDLNAPFASQVVRLANACGLTSEEWQTLPILVVPPALSFIAVLLLAELHGRMGYFPPCIRLRPVEGALPPRYEVAEVMDLQRVREEARQRRYGPCEVL